MHINSKNSLSLDDIVAAVEQLDYEELHRVQEAIDRRRETRKQSTVLERRDYGSGILQLESRAYKRKKDNELRERGPYWYFHYREGGRQRTLYIGKTDNPELVVDEKLGME